MFDIHGKHPTETECIAYLEKIRWDGQPRCPYCGSGRISSLESEQRHHCNNCYTTFSVTVGTIFHHTHLPLQKWFQAIGLVLNSNNDITARQLAGDLGVNKNTAWYLKERIRKAMTGLEQRELLLRLSQIDDKRDSGG